MANIKSAKKRIKQSEKRRIKNSAVKSSIRTATKKMYAAIEKSEGTDPQKINELFNDFVKKVDTASRKRILHKNTAARKKSRLAKKINSLAQQQQSE